MRVENVSDLLLVHRRNAVLASHGINTNTRSPPTVDIGEQAFWVVSVIGQLRLIRSHCTLRLLLDHVPHCLVLFHDFAK